MIDPEGYVGRVWLVREKRTWVIECEPDVMVRLKRIFERVPKSAMGRAPLADNPVNCQELRWFLLRYPMRISAEDQAHLEQQEAVEKTRQGALTKVLAGQYTPTDFKVAIKPWDFQPLPAELALAAGGVLCADEVGLGKTLEGALLISDPRARPALVVCPAHLVAHWEEKLAEYLPGVRVHALKKGTPYPLTNGARGREAPFPDVVISTYSKLAGWAETLATVVKSVVLDEVHNLCHETTDNGRKPVKKYAAAIHLRDHVPYRMGLSGTPIRNYGGEMRVVMNVLLPDALGTEEEFAREHCGGRRGEKAKVVDPDALGSMLVRRGLMTNRTREQVGRFLPPVKVFTQPVEVDMHRLDRVRMDTVEYAKTLLRYAGDPDAKRQAAKEIDWRLRHATGLAKAPAVAEFVKILAGRSSVLLFGWHKDFWHQMAWLLRDFKPVFYTGEETAAQKKRAVDAFIRGESQVFCMSLAAGEGLDGLQKVCSTVVIGELGWSWTMMMKQNIGRLQREGQKNSVFVHVMLADEGADPVMADALGVKRDQFQGLIRPGDHEPEATQTDPGHVKELARAWLAKADPRALHAIEAEAKAAEEQKATEKAARAAKRGSRKVAAPSPPAPPGQAANDDCNPATAAPSTPPPPPDPTAASDDCNPAPTSPWANRLRPSRRATG